MQICDYRKICNAHLHESHFQSRFGICDAVNRITISRWISEAVVLANMHYSTDCNLSCAAPKASGFFLLNSQLDYGVGTLFLHMTHAQPHLRRGCAGSGAVRR